MNPDGSGLKNLTGHPSRDNAPAWSPDGKRIAFLSYRDGNKEIYVMNADGSEQRRLTDSPDLDGDICWAPNSKTIAAIEAVS